MRLAPILLPLALCAAPAIAQPKPIQLPPELTDPAAADRLAEAMQAASRAVLDTRLGDLARRDDPLIDRRVEQQIAAARPKIEQSLRALNQALPEIAADLQRAQAALKRAVANMPDPNYPRK